MTKDHPRDFSRGKTIGIHVGEPMPVTRGKGDEQSAELHRRMSDLLATAIAAYPDEEQPPGAWWLPASYGGSAPTPEEAARLDAEEKERRAARRAGS